MTILKFPQKQPDQPFFNDIIEFGFHVFSLKNAKIPDFYPNDFPDYPGVSLKDLKVGDVITVRVFFRIGSDEDIRADGGYLDLEIGDVFHDGVTAVILTQLPEEFPLTTGDSLDVFEEEILYRNKVTNH
jgi:hypothetical protein